MVDTAPPRPVVFLTDVVEVERSSREVEDRLLHSGSELLPIAGEATACGQTMLLTVGPAIGERVVGVPVKVQLGPRWTRDGRAAIPIRWEAATFESLFPVLDGTLLVAPLGDHLCSITIEASYRPPLEAFGAILDRLLLHRVAESTVREFLKRLAVCLSEPG